MEPLISIRLPGSHHYQPGQRIVWHYQIDAVSPADIAAVEASVVWRTEGKGELDLGVHFFERRVPGRTEMADFLALRRIELQLPHAPLTYDGVIVQIRWCARVRLFLQSGRVYTEQLSFRLGNVPPARAVPLPWTQERNVPSEPRSR